MNDIMVHKPILGTNQYKVKFGAKIKRKLKVSTKTKVRVAILIMLVSSFYLNYYLLKTNYTITCKAVIGGVTQDWDLGHLMSNTTCSDLINDRIAALNVQANLLSQGQSDQTSAR